MRRVVVLLNRDLRSHDHPALAAAVREADEVVPLFVLDPGIPAPPNRLAFLLDALADLPWIAVRRGDPVEEALRLSPDAVYATADVSGYAQARQRRLAERVELRLFPGVLAVELPKPYRVFTPYWRAWSAAERRSIEPPVELPPVERRLPGRPRAVSAELARGGETAARRRLRAWLRDGLPRYGRERGGQDLGADLTSRLSPYLHFGCLSPLEVVEQTGERADAEPWLRELCWRDFYAQLLRAEPRTSREDLRPRPRELRDDPEALAAWKSGRTGYPLVDAGMRQLAREGWMHNRARLVTASFLVHDLGLDWRVGAVVFERLLVDGDVASNRGNWQWVAGTGVDPRRGRTFSPTLQARKRDPTGAYVRRYVPELDGLEPPFVHEPWRLPADELARRAYPLPIVERVETRGVQPALL